MRAIVLSDEGFPASYVKSGIVRLDYVPQKLDFPFLLLADIDPFEAPKRFKWLARVSSCSIKPGVEAVEVQLDGYWALTGTSRELQSLIELDYVGSKYYATLKEEIWQKAGAPSPEGNPPSESPGFLSLKEATLRLASSYGVPESSVKISITN
ncbi:hypothetical protein [Pseudomonas sp. BJa3]|uniref:hypothetical protein n=1 Tax=Pseudomonas sp. BJa3 TaxID=2986525 RepID=UPI002265AE58|nr:hypothetical protein [Pseudomonas sp. BJa3]MCX5511191.1 hypothetical protein [Pseudomonas sp. BJa3]